MFQPTTFGKYFLTRRIAVGGMAEVFAAKLYGADGFEKDLVIKQILPQYARDPEFVQSFVTEAKIAVSLTHANIVGIYELGRVDGTYFIAMELVDGLDGFTLSLESKNAGRRLDIGLALLITEEVAKGLDYAHRKHGPDGKPLGLVHRDLNPRNVLVSREGDVKILDFGIAKTTSQVTAMPKTRVGVVKGTTGYMSPEQAVGDVVDSRTDVYQAGLLLWELLTQEPLFWRADDQETRERMRRHHVAPPSVLRNDVPMEIDELVVAALARDKRARIQSASELARRIGAIRYARYPEANPIDLGRMVSELMDLKSTKEERASEALPSTMELDEAINEVLASSGRNIETIARASSDIVRAQSALRAPSVPGPPIAPDVVAPSASTPIPDEPRDAIPQTTPVVDDDVLDVATEPTVEEPEAEEEEADEDQPVTALPPPPAASVGTRVLAIALLLVLGGVGIAWYARSPETKPAIAQHSPPPPTKRVVEPPPPAPPPTVQTSTPTKAPPPPPPPPRKVRTKAKWKRKPPPPPPVQGWATIAFGTRSCSSRVSIDGEVVARSTPSFDHRVSAGTHSVLIEGTSCPPIERPGSLRRTIPTVAKRIRVQDGDRLKVIADYEREQLIVRRQ